MRDRTQRLAQAPRSRPLVRHRIVLAVKLDRLLTSQDPTHDLDVLAGARQRLAERLAVPTLDHLRARHSEPERETTVRQVIDRQRGHRGRRGSARRDLDDAGTQANARGVGADPCRGRERIGAPRLRRPHGVVLEALRLLRERDRERVGLCTPVAELKSEFHAHGLARRADSRHERDIPRRDRPRLAHLDALVAARSGAARGRAERTDARAGRRRDSRNSAATDPTSRPPRSTVSAANGTRFTNFHTTALCSPTRACLLSGRNHHRNGMGRVADLAVGYPGYWGRIPRENGFLPEILRANGYATYAVGKWHLTPDDETHMASSRASWPLARGFDRWYGFHGGETHQFVPSLYHDNHSVLPPASPEDGYHLSADLADRAIGFLGDLRAVDADRPFFCYFATGACHSPHHAPKEWIDRYKGHFDAGLGRVARRHLRPPDRERHTPRAHAAVAAPTLGSRVGLTESRRPSGRGALHGVLCRVPLLHRRADRRGCRSSSPTPATSTTP